MHDKLDYEKAIRKEEEWWNQKLPDSEPDHRLRYRALSPRFVWEDPDVEDLIRGAYKERLLYPSKLKGLRVFDLGCGYGWLALELARQGHRVDACDISTKRIELAKSYYQQVKGRERELGEISYYRCDLNKIELPRDTYDVIVCWDSFHHVLESKRLIQQVYSSLKIGGRFIGFDHIDQKSRLVILLNLLAFSAITLVFELRTFVRLVYRKISRKFSHKLRVYDEEIEPLHSPFEAITGKEIINYFIEQFGQQQVAFETTLAFGATWLAKIPGPRKLRLAIVSLVKKIDGYLIRKGIVQGEYAFIEATKT